MRDDRVSVPAGDEGYSLVEVLVAIALISITMAAMGTYFTTSYVVTARQRGVQGATELGNSAVEQVRALKGSSLATGRSRAKANYQFGIGSGAPQPPAVIKPYLTSMVPAYDEYTKDSTLGDDASISTATQSMTVDSTVYARTIYLGACEILLSGNGKCDLPADPTASGYDATKYLKFFRAVILVTWPGRGCTDQVCSYVTSTLVARAPEPTFDYHRPSPVIKNFTVYFLLGRATTYQLEATGGQLPNTWTVTTLPPGFPSPTPAGVISGTATKVGTWASQVTVKDKLGRTDTETVNFVVVPPASMTVPADTVSYVGAPVTLQATMKDGQSPYTYTAKNLPDGLSINGSTGAITGTTTATGSWTVTVTGVDSSGLYPGNTVTGTYKHSVYTPLTLAAIADQTINLGSTFTATAAAAGGDGSYTYTATGLPVGVVVNASTGVMSGLPTVPGRYVPTVTVSDGSGGTARVNFVLIVNTTSSLIFTTPSVTAPGDLTTTVGTATSMTFDTNAALLGLKPKLTADGLPPGLKFNAGQGVISGTPTTAGTYVVTVVATSALPPQVSNYSFIWTVK